MVERIEMAELQWIVEVRCVNALLAHIKVGERGQHFIIEVPNRAFDPSEFAKLIEGVKAAKVIGNEHYAKSNWTVHTANDATQSPRDAKIIENRDLYDIQLLSTGELALVATKHTFFAPSELDQFLQDLTQAQQQMERLRETAKV
jgi:hypothetical protein